MKALFQISNLLLGASLFTFAQAEAHAHAHAHGHEVRSPADVLPNLERDAASREARDHDSHGGKKDHSGGGGWNGDGYAAEYKGYGSPDSNDGHSDRYGDGYGDGYGNGEGAESTSTVIINITEEGSYGYGMSTVAVAGDHTSIMETMTIATAS
jgi:hypothetical protein